MCKIYFDGFQIHIDVLYESLCPDSIEFITKQLYPAWNEIAPYVDIKLIPFGKSAVSDAVFIISYVR